MHSTSQLTTLPFLPIPHPSQQIHRHKNQSNTTSRNSAIKNLTLLELRAKTRIRCHQPNSTAKAPPRPQTPNHSPASPASPPELRRLIWKHASFHPRDVDITASFDRYTLPRDLDFSSSPETFHYLSISPPPALLSTTRESRSEALKHYSLDFPSLSISKTPLTTGSTVSEDKPHVYVNWKVDRLCLVNWGLIARWTHAGRDFKERCKRNGLRFLACNLQGHFERRGREFLRSGVEVEEVAFFHSKVVLYERPRARTLRIEDRRMTQVGAYREIVDFVQADRRRREELESLGSEGGSSGSAVTPLVVKLVRLMQ